jgi:hypothetical protein
MMFCRFCLLYASKTSWGYIPYDYQQFVDVPLCSILFGKGGASMKWSMYLLALLAVGPPLVAEGQGIPAVDAALQGDFAAYRELRRDLAELGSQSDRLRDAMLVNRGSMDDFRRINVEHKVLLDKVTEVTPKLEQAYHELAEGSVYLREDSEQLLCLAGQIAQEAYAVFQAASQVNCAAAALPGQLRALNTAFEIGKLLSFGLGMAVGYAMGAGSASSTTTTTKGGFIKGGGSPSPWGAGSPSPWGIGSPSPWGGGGGGWMAGFFSKTVTTSSAAGLSGLLALPLPFFAGGGGAAGGCVGANCIPATPCVGAACVPECNICVEEAKKKCDGTPACIEKVKKGCKACEGEKVDPNQPLAPIPDNSLPPAPAYEAAAPKEMI